MTVVRLAPEEAEFYSAQSVFSDPGEFAALYEDLPRDAAGLARAVRDLLVHRVEGGQFGIDIAPERMRDDAETRYVDDILRLITSRDSAPLARRREYADRFVAICRDFTLLHVSMLRHGGVPARMRVGFTDYFGTDGFHGDHVVTEYWDEARGRWVLADAQLADPSFAPVPLDFDPMDIPRDRFLVAGAAWRMIRAGRADPRTFGLPPEGGPMTGEWFVANDVRLDLAALNRSETLLWDVWGAGAGSDAEMTDEIRALYDTVADTLAGGSAPTAVSPDDIPFTAARTLFTTHDGLRTPPTVLSLAPFNGPSEVTLR